MLQFNSLIIVIVLDNLCLEVDIMTNKRNGCLKIYKGITTN